MSKPCEVDVLIIGAGPSGLAAATWFSRLDIKTRIIDQRATRALAGRGDGVHARTVEILDSFGLGTALREAGSMLDDFVVWGPDGHGNKRRLDRQPVWGSETSLIKPYMAHQGHLEAILLDGLKRAANPIEVERAVKPIDIKIDSRATPATDLDAYPVTVTVKHLGEEEAGFWPNNAHTVLPNGQIRDEPSTKICPSVSDGAYQTTFQKTGKEGTTETIRAKFVLGADGAHSWVRRQLGISMEGSASDSVWGVIDVVPITNYPDIRRQGPIVSSKHEPIVNVPRENGLSRFYVPLPGDFAEKDSFAALANPSHQLCKTIMSIAQGTFHPYTSEYEYCDWYTLYKVGRRSASAYGDPTHRVFIAGDACHTHTPKAGQGMNISMQDSYNLAWKIAGVLKGQLRPEVLATYEQERRPIGQKLVELDEYLSKGLGEAAEDRGTLMQVYDLLRKFTDGRAVVYKPGLAVAQESGHGPAWGVQLGTRLHNHYIRGQSTSWLRHMMDLLPSNGRWRLVVYGGDISDQDQLERVNRLGEAIAEPGLLVHRYRSLTPGKPWLEVLLIHTADVASVSLETLHEAYHPQQEKYGGTSWHQVWAEESLPPKKGSVAPGPAHRSLDIDPHVGAMAMIRPDTFVGWAGGYEDLPDLERYCAGLFVS
ncbi:Phenol hydroxylase [Exophiala dermatitidis]